MIGVLNATAEWIFAFPGRLSVTISGADRLLDAAARGACARRSGARSRRSPACRPTCRPGRSCASGARPSRRRRSRTPSAPAPNTRSRNLFLAGDWTDTGLPATIEGAIRSGNRAADLALRTKQQIPMSDTTITSAGCGAEQARSALEQHIRAATDALLADQQPDGHWVFELEADATIPAEYVLLRHYFAEPADAELERKIARLSAPHPGRAWRLAAVPRRRLRHERQREGLFRAEDDRRRHRRRPHAARARGDPVRAAARRRATCSPARCSRSTA